MDGLPNGWRERSPKQIAAIVLLIFMAMVLSFVEFPVVPGAEWLKYDPSGIVSLLATILYGSWIGIAVAVASWLPHLLTDPLGAFMNIMATVSLITVVGTVYRRKPCLSHAVLGCAAGVLVSTAVSICLNFVVMPPYAGVSYEETAALILPALLPFNVFKALANSIVAIASYHKLAMLLEDQPGGLSASGQNRS
ncbi:MAG: hypothetical protein RRZ85_10670 [Gordonibacter sp.]|uniref:ECF transporter S component n=1 Tax=Gordonibacter sp. TaxID=1968902 RepID=UPI002FC87DF2